MHLNATQSVKCKKSSQEMRGEKSGRVVFIELCEMSEAASE